MKNENGVLLRVILALVIIGLCFTIGIFAKLLPEAGGGKGETLLIGQIFQDSPYGQTGALDQADWPIQEGVMAIRDFNNTEVFLSVIDNGKYKILLPSGEGEYYLTPYLPAALYQGWSTIGANSIVINASIETTVLGPTFLVYSQTSQGKG